MCFFLDGDEQLKFATSAVIMLHTVVKRLLT